MNWRFWESKQPTPPPVQTTFVPPELFDEIHRLKEQADWMGKLLEDDERNFTYGEDGTIQFGMTQNQPDAVMFSYSWAYGQGLFRPSYGAAFFINEAQHRIMRARSRAFCSINPYWHGVQHNIRTHVVGKGHTWTAMPRHPATTVPKEALAKVQKELDEFYEAGYRQVQAEKCDRKSRDGEYFLQYLEEDKRLRVRFVEPLCVWTPPGATEADGVWFGIRFARGDYEKPLRYHVRTTDFLGATSDDDPAWSRGLAPETIQHRKVNVDRGTIRGVPDTYWVQARLEQAKRTLEAMGTLVQVRAKIAMIRKRINALAGSVQPMLSAQAAATVAGPGGQVRNVFQYPYGAILDTSDAAEYQFPGQNIETDKIVASVQADLQAVATSVGLADYMVSGNLGSGSFASAMVAEGPVVKTFEEQQQDMIDEDQEVVRQVIEVAIKHGRLPEDTLETIKVEMSGPTLAGRNAIQEAQADHIHLEDGVISLTTVQQRLGLNPETEEANKKANPTNMVLQANADAAMSAAKIGGGSSGSSTGAAPRNRQTSNARPFSASQEPRQQQRAMGMTREEELFEEIVRLRMQESQEPQSQDNLTGEDLAMGAYVIAPDWLAKTKLEILALAQFGGSPRDNAAPEEYEHGVAGIRLGAVDGQDVWAVDMRAMMVKHACPDLVVAGNSQRWTFVPRDRIVVDWSFASADRACDILHELVEQRLCEAGWSYARAHRYANQGPGCEADWLLDLRPELAALQPPKE